MKINRSYMKSVEFAARQAWLDFGDAVGTALEVISPSLTEARKWFKKFVREFTTKVQQTENGNQLNLFKNGGFIS